MTRRRPSRNSLDRILASDRLLSNPDVSAKQAAIKKRCTDIFELLESGNSRWVYLLLGLDLHKPYLKARSRIEFRPERDGVQAVIRPAMTTPMDMGFGWPHGIYTIVFPLLKTDDALAERIVHAFWGALGGMMRQGGINEDDPPMLLRIPRALLGSRYVFARDLILAWTEHTGELDFVSGYSRLTGLCRYADAMVADAWRILPAVITPGLFDATQFLWASVRAFNPASVSFLWAPDKACLDTAESTRLESVAQDAYKAIEALIGDPPAKEAKLRSRMLTRGIDPDQLVGFDEQTREPLIAAVRRLNSYRDKRCAHGSYLRRQKLRYIEVYEMQECARFMLHEAVNDLMLKRGWKPDGQKSH